jgi:two-component system sensor histidine kinase KdpD
VEARTGPVAATETTGTRRRRAEVVDMKPPTRGRLRIYLGFASGVGKTYALLSEGRRRAKRGTDVVVACLETRGRPRTAALLKGLETIPYARTPFLGSFPEEIDLDALLGRRPEVVLLDELAHTNMPGSRHVMRWQDAEELLTAGIDVISTVDVRQLDSLRDVVEKITGVPSRETVPDAFVRLADEVEMVDIAPEELRDRMAHGDIYQAEQAETALAGHFRIGNLSALRELALLWLAATLAEDRQRYGLGGHVPAGSEARERVVVALTSGPDGEALIRRAARIAVRSAGDLLAVHVARPGGTAGTDRAALSAQRRLVQSVGGAYHELSDDDICAALLTFARAENATQLVLGATRRSWPSALLSRTGIRSQIIYGAAGIDVHITHTQTASSVPRRRVRRNRELRTADDRTGRFLPQAPATSSLRRRPMRLSTPSQLD